MISAVIFDFDGVLADTELLHMAAFVEVFESRGWHLDEKAYFDRYLGFDDRGLIRAFAADNDLALTAAAAEELGAAKARAFAHLLQRQTVLYPETPACVAALSSRFRLAIASGALHREIATILETASLLQPFSVIVGADDVTQTKPSPMPYLEAAARLGIPPGECVAVEDSRSGLAAARAAGMKTIALPTTSPRNLLADADRIVATLADVTPDLVTGLD